MHEEGRKRERKRAEAAVLKGRERQIILKNALTVSQEKKRNWS